MSAMSERIAKCIEKSGLTKTAFAEKIGVSQPFISQLCAGTASPSDRTIRDICLKFDIDREWLQTGKGEMDAQMMQSETISGFMAGIFSDDTDFRRRFISILAKLTPAEWALIESMAHKLAEDEKNTAPEGAAPEDATDQ